MRRQANKKAMAMRDVFALTTLLATLALGTAAFSQSTPAVPVQVSLGPKLLAKADDLGSQELMDLTRDLKDEVQSALARSREKPSQVNLVLEDAVPNRPTFAQLSRTVSLSPRSIGLGGASVSGSATYPDGTTRPIKVQYYETDLRDVVGYATWSDADRAFGQVAYDLGHGRFPDHFEGSGPSRSGHFGYPFTQQ